MQFFGEDCALRVVALKILFRPEEKDVQMANAIMLRGKAYEFIFDDRRGATAVKNAQ